MWVIRYFDKETVGLDFEGMKADIKVCYYTVYVILLLTLISGRSRGLHHSSPRLCSRKSASFDSSNPPLTKL